MIKVQKSKLIKTIRYDDDDKKINLRFNTHGCELIKMLIKMLQMKVLCS